MTKRLQSPRMLAITTFLITFTITLGLIIVPIESGHPEANFQTAEDGIWWAVTTITAVGYGDYYPVTTLGRIIGITLETVGVTFFGLVITFITIQLLRREQSYFWSRETERFDRLEQKLNRLESQQAYSIKQTDANEPD